MLPVVSSALASGACLAFTRATVRAATGA